MVMTIPEVLGALSNESSRKGKEDILKGNDSQLLRDVLFYSYNPELVYNVEKIPFEGRGEGFLNDVDWKGVLLSLSTRELSGNEALQRIRALIEGMEPSEGDLFRRIIQKDLSVGVGVSTINKVFPELVPEYPYMRCSLPKDSNLKNFDWSEGVFSQVKADGMFCNIAIKEDGEVVITSRKGNRFSNSVMADLIGTVTALGEKGMVYHGELVVSRKGTILAREIGNGMLNSVLRGGEFQPGHHPLFYVWDVVPLSEWKPSGKYEVGYEERWGMVESMSGMYVRPIETRLVFTFEQAIAHYQECLGLGLEGTILKSPKAIWWDGNSKEQVKLKVEFEVDLRVKGYNPGEGKFTGTLGSLIVESSCGEVEVSVSGFSDAVRASLFSRMEELISSQRIITVRANDIMPPTDTNDKYSLFLPRFVEERLDKTEADDLQRVKGILLGAKNFIVN